VDDLQLLTVKDLADLLRCSVYTVRRKVRLGLLPPPLVLGPRLHRWRRRDVERLTPGRLVKFKG
jgi:excisionase family DNA binding protein